MFARRVGLVFLAACGTHPLANTVPADGAPGDAPAAAARLRVFDRADTLFQDGQYMDPLLYVHVCVACPGCGPGQPIAGTYLGTAMQSLTSSQGSQAVRPSCNADESELVTREDGSSAAGNDVVGASGSGFDIVAQLPGDAVAPRSVTAAGAAGQTLCPGVLATYTWSPASDVAAQGSGSVVGAPQMFCQSGTEDVNCIYAPRLGTVVTTIDQTITFTPPPPSKYLTTTTAMTLTFTVPDATRSGSAVTCTGAASCSYSFQHEAQVLARVAPSCP